MQISPPSSFTLGGVPEHFNLPWHMALRSGEGPELGVSLAWEDYPGGTGDMCRALASGELDLAVLLTEGILKHIASGGEARLVGTYTATPLVWGIHVAADGPIQTVEQLEGARYAISRAGSGSQLMAALDAAQRGWAEPGYVTVGDLDGGREALREGRAEAFMWEKTMSLPLVHSGEWRRVGEFAGPWPAFVIAASAQALARGMDWLPELLQHVSAACVRAETDRAATVRFIGDSYNIPQDDILAWLDRTRWSCRADVSAGMLQTTLDILRAANIIEQAIAPADAVAAASYLAP